MRDANVQVHAVYNSVCDGGPHGTFARTSGKPAHHPAICTDIHHCPRAKLPERVHHVSRTPGCRQSKPGCTTRSSIHNVRAPTQTPNHHRHDRHDSEPRNTSTCPTSNQLPHQHMCHEFQMQIVMPIPTNIRQVAVCVCSLSQKQTHVCDSLAVQCRDREPTGVAMQVTYP